MASEEKKYTPEFKVEVAEEAIRQEKKNLDNLAEKYDLSVSRVLMWTAEYEKNGPQAFEEQESAEEKTHEQQEEDFGSVDVQVTDEDISRSVEIGVMTGDLNIKKITFWSIVGFVILNIFVGILYEMYQRDEQVARERISSTNEYYQVNQLKNQQQKKLSDFSMVDAENGIYRIPIDSAINDIAIDSE